MDTLAENLSRREKAKLREQTQELQAALRHEPTRRFLRRLIDVTGVFVPDSPNDARAIGLWVIAEMNEADPHAFPRMLQDAANAKVGEREHDF